jgi:hypothetical protein
LESAVYTERMRWKESAVPAAPLETPAAPDAAPGNVTALTFGAKRERPPYEGRPL